MKRLFFSIALIFLFAWAFGQNLSRVTLSNSGNAYIISFKAEDGVIVNMTSDGNIIDWGVEVISDRNYPERLDKYLGKVEYYAATDNIEENRGKVKYIGRTAFTYYTAYENEAFKGKVKTLGTILFDYYNPYDDEVSKGKIKSAGIVPFSYYGSFENDAYKGKLKKIGATTLTYYASFDDKAYQGKIRSIADHIFTYYSSYDKKEYNGAIKTGYQTQYMINGIKYFLRN